MRSRDVDSSGACPTDYGVSKQQRPYDERRLLRMPHESRPGMIQAPQQLLQLLQLSTLVRTTPAVLTLGADETGRLIRCSKQQQHRHPPADHDEHAASRQQATRVLSPLQFELKTFPLPARTFWSSTKLNLLCNENTLPVSAPKGLSTSPVPAAPRCPLTSGATQRGISCGTWSGFQAASRGSQRVSFPMFLRKSLLVCPPNDPLAHVASREDNSK